MLKDRLCFFWRKIKIKFCNERRLDRVKRDLPTEELGEKMNIKDEPKQQRNTAIVLSL